MAQITLHYNNGDLIAQRTLDYLLSLGIFSTRSSKKQDSPYSEAFLERMRQSEASEKHFVNVDDIWK